MLLLRKYLSLAASCIIFLSLSVSAQTRAVDSLPFSSNYYQSVAAKFSSLNSKLDKTTDKAVRQLSKHEEKIRRKLMKIDSIRAKAIFADANQRYQQLQNKLKNPGKLTNYIPYLDTLHTSFKFLGQNGNVSQQFTDAFGKVKELEGNMQKAEEIRQFMKERRDFLCRQLEGFGFAKQLKQLNKQVYYYQAQVNEYKSMLRDKKKLEKKAIELLSQTRAFQDFMRGNSILASMFRLPGDPNDPASQISSGALQTRTQVNNLIQQQISSGGPNAQAQLQQNLQQGQAQLQQLKDKVMQFGGSSSGDEVPDFKPNNQKTKSFLQRLELGSNFQTQKQNTYFPVTSDIGLSVGYKLNDKSVIGVGAAYKLGWGHGWNNIHMSNEGVGLRSYIDWKLKGSFYISGGYEENYNTAFASVQQLKNYSGWQQSGLIGLSKIVALKSKLFKKTKLQLLWDMLSYQQLPRTQPVLLRFSYGIK
jgi:hypothetical protein